MRLLAAVEPVGHLFPAVALGQLLMKEVGGGHRFWLLAPGGH